MLPAKPLEGEMSQGQQDRWKYTVGFIVLFAASILIRQACGR